MKHKQTIVMHMLFFLFGQFVSICLNTRVGLGEGVLARVRFWRDVCKGWELITNLGCVTTSELVTCTQSHLVRVFGATGST